MYYLKQDNMIVNEVGCFVIQISLWKQDIGYVKYDQKWDIKRMTVCKDLG